MGMLSSLYQAATFAYVGGGFGAGIHNTLEPAAFGKPVVFGPNYSKFQEARDLVKLGGGFSIQSVSQATELFDKLLDRSIKISSCTSFCGVQI